MILRNTCCTGLLLSTSALVGCSGSDPPTVSQQPSVAPAATAPTTTPAPVLTTPTPPPAQTERLAWVGKSDTEPFNVQEFLDSRAAPEDNAAPLCLKALKQLDVHLDLSIRRLTDTDTLQAALRRSDGAHRIRVERALETVAPALDLIDRAQASSACVFAEELRYDMLLPYIGGVRNLARVAMLQLYLARAKGDVALALSSIKRVLRLSRDRQVRGGVACQLVLSAVDNIIMDSCRLFFLSDPKLSLEQCDAVIALLLEHNRQSLDRNGEAIRVEYIVTRQLLEDLQAGTVTLAEVREYVASWNDLSGVGNIDFASERLACDRVFHALLRESALPYYQATAQAAEFTNENDALLAETSFLRTWGVPYGKNSPRYSAVRAEIELSGTLLLAAIRRFEVSQGYLPKSLEEAIADTGLDAVPLDPHTGEPMKYVLINKRPTVYSIGRDGTDDGGRIDWLSRRDQKGDYVFAMSPLPGTRTLPSDPTARRGNQESALSAVKSSPLAMRAWTSTVGTTIEAEFVRLVQNDTIALLKKKDGTTLRVPLEKLGNADRAWIQKLNSD